VIKKLYHKIRNSWFREVRFLSQPITANYAEIELAERLKDAVRLERYGCKVYSQSDEDGIIAEIFNRIGTANKVFVEFGVENGLESNGHFLLHKGWQGLWIEGSSGYCKQIRDKFKEPIAKKQLNIVNAFIDKDNINAIIEKAGITGSIDFLSIDVDGNDYWIWEAIDCIQPRAVCIEYNAKFPPDFEWIMKYNKTHIADNYDNQGASLKSLEILGKKLDFQLVGTNLNGVNAFFVKKNLAKDLFIQPATAENLYNPPRAYCGFKYISGRSSNCYIGE
jgi:hypothetical protein